VAINQAGEGLFVALACAGEQNGVGCRRSIPGSALDACCFSVSRHVP
jgi:hypothetical protein